MVPHEVKKASEDERERGGKAGLRHFTKKACVGERVAALPVLYFVKPPRKARVRTAQIVGASIGVVPTLF